MVNTMTSNVHENQSIMHRKNIAKRDQKGILPNETQSKQVALFSFGHAINNVSSDAKHT